MLGQDVVAELERRGIPHSAPSVGQLDLCSPDAVAQVAARHWKAAWCVNCAAYTAVDKAETETDKALAANGLGPSYLARACTLAEMRLLHVSTDFVFDGKKAEPYDEEDEARPKSVYGRSKLAGEDAVLGAGPQHLVVRTSWLYGPRGASFPKAILKAWLTGKPLRVVADQIGCPTYTADLARVLVDLMAADVDGGIVHAVGPEQMSWHKFAVLAVAAYAKTMQQREVVVAIEPIETADWPTPAPRPAYSVLSNKKLEALGIAPMRPVPEALEEFSRRLAAGLQVG